MLNQLVKHIETNLEIIFLVNLYKMRIGFIGVGKLGRDAAEVMSENHFVEGYDVSHVEPTNFKMVDTIQDVCNNKEII
jgi:UDPglucose 6-dehydrogenase